MKERTEEQNKNYLKEGIIGDYDKEYSMEVFQSIERRGGEKFFFEKLDIDAKSLENLKKPHNLQRVYISNHLSHFDYAEDWFLFHREDVKMPLIPAGTNLDIFWFKWFKMDFGKGGGFFINRDLINSNKKGHREHKVSIGDYVVRKLEEGNDFLVFPNGGRAYSGETFERFQGGILKNILRTKKEFEIVNIAIDYDNVIEKKYFNYLKKCTDKKKKAHDRGNKIFEKIYATKYLTCDVYAFAKRYFIKKYCKKRENEIGNVYVRIDEPIPVSNLFDMDDSLNDKLNYLETYSRTKINLMRNGIEKKVLNL